MKVLVTGATGFLGSHVVDQLIAAKHSVRALVRKTSKVDHLRSVGAELALGSVERTEGLAEAMTGVDAVVHSAGIVKARTPEEFHEVNAGGTRNLLDAARANAPKLKRFVYVSSLAAHGPSPDGLPRAHDDEPNPVTHYGRSKLEGERAVLAASGDLPVTVLRPPVIYGPRDNEMFAFFQIVSRRLVPLIGDGQNTLSIVYVEDCARAVCDFLTKDHPSGRVYTVDDGRAHSWGEMGTILEGVLGVRALRVKLPVGVFSVAAIGSELYGKLGNKAVMLTRDKVNELRARHFVCSSSAIKDELGWEPEMDFERGARVTADWYRANGWL